MRMNLGPIGPVRSVLPTMNRQNGPDSILRATLALPLHHIYMTGLHGEFSLLHTTALTGSSLSVIKWSPHVPHRSLVLDVSAAIVLMISG